MPFLLGRAIIKNHREPEKWLYLAQRIGLAVVQVRRSKVIWIHAVSVGEVVATIPLVKNLAQGYPEHQIILSTTTIDGAKIVRARLASFVTHVYFPLDIPFVISRFLNRLKPTLFIMIETELWPNLLLKCKRRGIPSVILNGRLSDKSAKSYLNVKSISREMMSNVSLVLARDAIDANNFVRLGLSCDKVRVIGNMKFDSKLSPDIIGDHASENCSKHGLIACFASIHEGELTILIDAMLRLRRKLPNIQFVLVPRHPAKLEKYVSYLRRHDINFVSGNYQAYTRCEQPLDTFVVDSIGELLKFYSASDVAFVGGSIVPLGGQNLLEPIGVGVPVITGTSLYNFQEIADALISLDIIVAVSDAPSIAKEIWHLLEDGQERESRSARGRDWLISKRGATQRAADALRLFL